MHNISIADRIIREAQSAGAEKFFRVEIGELCEITREELKEGLELLCSPTVVENFNSFGGVVLHNSKEAEINREMKFVVDFVESKIRCECGFIGRANILDRGHGYCIWDCPKCGAKGTKVKVLRGGEIKVTEVE